VLGPGFDVHADAADDVAVMRVDLSIDGAVQATDTAAPYTFTTSDALPEGPHDVEVRAYDARGNVELYAIRVNVSFAADPDGDGWGGGGQAGESVVIGGCAAASGRDADAATGFLALLFASLAYTLRRVVTMATRRRRRRYH
jgi:hypothetical protein